MKKKLKVGSSIKQKSGGWSFNGDIVNNFEKHIKSSIPYYKSTHDIFIRFSDFFIKENSNVYDLGCSTGSFLINLHKRNSNTSVKYIGYDNQKNMINFAKKKLHKSQKNIFFYQKDINKINFLNTSLIVSFYTIQFIDTAIRQDLINKIYSSLSWGGAFFFIEKVRGPDARFQDILNQFYHEFKLDSGFSYEEVLNKTMSLKGILEPFSSEGNLGLLKRAGFKDIMTVMKWGCFEGIIAIK
jgi:tRNA (cmo5U34)-methyltransferase